MEKTAYFNGFASEIESKANRVAEITANGTDEQYPTARAVYAHTQRELSNVIRPDSDTEFIFDGGGAEADTTAGVTAVIDGELSDISGNAVANKAIKAYIDTAVLNAEKAAGLAAHPIGCLYWSRSPQDPAELFGGVWERIKDRFILAAGDEYSAGDIGGEKSRTLTVAEMPPHSHAITAVSGIRVLSGGDDWSSQSVNGNERITSGITGGTTTDTGTAAQPFDIMPPYEVYYCWQRTE